MIISTLQTSMKLEQGFQVALVGLNFASQKLRKIFGSNFASQRFEKFREDFISRMSLKTAENRNFWTQMDSFDWFLHPKFDVKNFAWIEFRESAISHVFASFNFAKMAKMARMLLWVPDWKISDLKDMLTKRVKARDR